MKKKISIMLILLALAGVYAITTAKADGGAPGPTPTAPRSPTATLDTPETCKVITGIDGGKVNLRACPGAACGAVLDILTEGASLDIIAAGEWMNVTTDSGVMGWLNKKYCEVRP